VYLQGVLTLMSTLWSLLPPSDTTNEVTVHIKAVKKQKKEKRKGEGKEEEERGRNREMRRYLPAHL